MADSSNSARGCATQGQTCTPTRKSATRGAMAWPFWFARTRPWLTGSAMVCTTLLGLILAFEPGSSVKTQRDVDDEEFVLLDDVNVYDSGSREESPLQVTEAPVLISPGSDNARSEAAGNVVQAAYTTDDVIDVIRPVEYQSSLSRGPQGAWLTGEIEEPAGAALKQSAEIATPPTR